MKHSALGIDGAVVESRQRTKARSLFFLQRDTVSKSLRVDRQRNFPGVIVSIPQREQPRPGQRVIEYNLALIAAVTSWTFIHRHLQTRSAILRDGWAAARSMESMEAYVITHCCMFWANAGSRHVLLIDRIWGAFMSRLAASWVYSQ